MVVIVGIVVISFVVVCPSPVVRISVVSVVETGKSVDIVGQTTVVVGKLVVTSSVIKSVDVVCSLVGRVTSSIVVVWPSVVETGALVGVVAGPSVDVVDTSVDNPFVVDSAMMVVSSSVVNPSVIKSVGVVGLAVGVVASSVVDSTVVAYGSSVVTTGLVVVDPSGVV